MAQKKRTKEELEAMAKRNVRIRAFPGYTLTHEKTVADGNKEDPELREAIFPAKVAEGFRGRARVKIGDKFVDLPPKDRNAAPGEQLHRMIESPRKK